MDAEFELKYQLMNAGHLLGDEVEYELAIRQIPFKVGDSRDAKRRRLRQTLKEQREKNNFEVVLALSSDECLRDLHVVDEKLAKIRDQLENRRTKKSELPELQTRLVHLYARLIRLKEKVDTDGLEGILLKLYQEHFTFLSTDPDVRKRTEENLSRQLTDLSIQDRSQESTDSESAEENSSDGVQEVVKKKVNDKDRNTSTPREKRKCKKDKDSEEMFKKLLEHVDSYLESRLSSVSGDKRKEASSSSEDIESEEAKRHKRKERRKRKDSSSDEVQERQRKITKDQGRREMSPRMRKSRNERSESENFSSEEGSSERSMEKQKRVRRQPRSVAEWKMKYDGKDEGRKLNKFITEVEFMAEAENLCKRDLFNEAIHLFSGEARTWYIDGKKNRDFRNWRELVSELKLEFQPPDMDFHYEQQAAQRRQKRSEKFQDYFNAVMEIFQYMAVAPSEQRMFDIVFRNLRSDYKNVLVVKGIRTLKGLKQWGRKLDSVNVWMYRNRETEAAPKTAQVHEVRRDFSRNDVRTVEKKWKSDTQTGKDSRSDQRTEVDRRQTIPKRQEIPKDDQRPGSSKSDLESRIANYRVPDKLTCFNCRGKYHHYKACLSEKEVFCTVCGFHNYTKERCPFCAKNGRTSA